MNVTDYQNLLLSLNPEDRLEQLKVDAYDIHEDESYFRNYSTDELAEIKESLATNSVRMSTLEDQFSKVKKEWKEKIDPVKREVTEDTNALKNKGAQVHGDLYLIKDEVNRMMMVFDANGQLVLHRRFLPDEHQLNLLKTGTE